MSSPVTALKASIRARLVADANVLALLRGPKIHDDPPRHAAFPHIALVSALARENGTSSDEGHATEVGLGIWCRGGSREGLDLAQAVAAALSGMAGDIGGHRLVNLAVLSVEASPLKDGETWRVLLRLRAITEVI